MTARLDSGSDSRNQRGVITLSEIRQQPELWPTTLERVAASDAHSIVQDRAAVICGAGSSAYAASAVAVTWTNAVALPTTDLLTFSKRELSHLAPDFVSDGVLVSLARSGERRAPAKARRVSASSRVSNKCSRAWSISRSLATSMASWRGCRESTSLSSTLGQTTAVWR
jgi:hypothetical protein